MHKINQVLVSWHNQVAEVLKDEGIEHFSCHFKIDNQGVCKFEIWFSIPSKNYSFNSSTIEAADPDEAINELVHRVQFQRRQSIACLPSPTQEQIS